MRFLAVAVLLSSTAGAAAPIQIHDAGDGSLRVIQPIPPVSAAAFATTRTLYLNRHGGTLTPGNNNSQTNTSSLVSHASTVTGWDVTDAKWAETMACVRDMWAPFDVTITDEDPGSTPHVEVFVGGSPSSIGFGGNIGGVAPMALDCSVVERSVVFVFPKNLGNRAQSVCEVVGQEVGHSYGLDHELEPSDPMTYLSYNGARTFRDKTASCGESTARPCGFEGFEACRANQNSFQILLDRLGAPGSDHVAPEVVVTSPSDHATVAPGFAVSASATDNVGVERMTLFVDGGMVAVDDAETIAMATDPNLPTGSHELVIEVADLAGNTATQRLTVSVEEEASTSPDFVPSLGCATSRDGGWLLALALVGLRRRRVRSRIGL